MADVKPRLIRRSTRHNIRKAAEAEAHLAAVSIDELRRLARLGVTGRLNDLREELTVIAQAFPDMVNETLRGILDALRSSRAESRRTMSAAQRQAASERMRRYWATRKTSDVKTAPARPSRRRRRRP
jgi:hypothetical protein